jgi:hypothetical protein
MAALIGVAAIVLVVLLSIHAIRGDRAFERRLALEKQAGVDLMRQIRDSEHTHPDDSQRGWHWCHSTTQHPCAEYEESRNG